MLQVIHYFDILKRLNNEKEKFFSTILKVVISTNHMNNENPRFFVKADKSRGTQYEFK